MNGVILRV